LPTCVKALAESERVGPQVFGQIQEILDRYQLNDKAPIVRITGCPNGCARPYSAEIGIVGQMPGLYAIFLGGEPEGQRLAFKVKDKVKTDDLPVVFDKLIGFWKAEGGQEEFLGDFVQRVGAERLGAVL
jgi:sulfite reductase beta subunit-like hemoprotein